MAKVLITGASGGIGEALARRFAKGGHSLLLTARGEEKLRSLAEELKKRYKVDAEVLAADLSLPGAADKVAEEARRRGFEADILVNNAGYGMNGPYARMSLADDRGMIDLNITALVELTRHLLPGMLARRKGRILNVASTAAFQPGPFMAVYYATKAFVLSYSEALDEELRNTGVTVTALCPGPVRTGFQDRAGIERKSWLRKAAMGAEEVAEAGYAGVLAGRRLVVPGLSNRMGTVLSGFLPRRLVAKMVRKMQER